MPAEPRRTPPTEEHALWARRLRAIAAPALAGTPLAQGAAPSAADAAAFVDAFADDRGHRRQADRPLLAALLGVQPGPAPAGTTPDASLWWALHDASIDPAAIIAPKRGPLLPELRERGIEIWTESELSALHALDRLAAARDDAALAARVTAAALWHLDELQPDNATNHPWATHVFVRLAAEHPAAIMHAETLVHNALVSMGRPDRFGAVVMLDSAAALDA